MKLLNRPTHKSLMKKICFRTPTTINKSIQNLTKDMISTRDKKTLEMMKQQAQHKLRFEKMNFKDRRKLKTIAKIRIPIISRR